MRIVLLCLLLSGCATARYLTEEQDAEMRRVCETQGCVILPYALWEQVRQLLGVMRDI